MGEKSNKTTGKDDSSGIEKAHEIAKEQGAKKIRWYPSHNDEQIIEQLLKLRGKKPLPRDAPLKNDLLSPHLTVNGLFAALALLDISGPAKNIRGIPNFFHIQKRETLIGITRKADIKLDDPATVALEHAMLIFYERDKTSKGFILRPVGDALVFVNGKKVTDQGIILDHGCLVKIGSAIMVFLQVNLINKDENI